MATIQRETLAQRVAALGCERVFTTDQLLSIIAELLAESSFSPLAVGGAPEHDYIGIAYYVGTNNIQTVTFKTGGAGGTTTGTWTLAYAGGGVADDDLLTSVTKA